MITNPESEETGMELDALATAAAAVGELTYGRLFDRDGLRHAGE
ncbi:hypothetical protein [Parasphingorhabdus pacifica]